MLGWDITTLTREIASRILNRATGDEKRHFGDQITVTEKGHLSWHSGGIFPHKHVFADYNVEGEDVVLLVDSTAGAVDIQLPPVRSENGHTLYIKRIAGAFQVAILPDGTEDIDGAASYTLTSVNQCVQIYGDVRPGHEHWQILSRFP